MYNIGIVGATGKVGEVFLTLLNERKFPVKSLKLFASANSKNKTILFQGTDYPVEVLTEGCFKNLDLVFFSSGDDISLEWAPKAVAQGAFAVDNSGAFRMDKETPLIVPEINFDSQLTSDKPCLIANPNCSTIQLVVALNALKRLGSLSNVHVSTYQSVSGAGKAGTDELLNNTQAYKQNSQPNTSTFNKNIAFNTIPQIGGFDETGFCTEELKIMRETRKILNLPDLQISAFTVRVPALNVHSEAVWVEFENEVSYSAVCEAFNSQEGLELISNDSPEGYPDHHTANNKNPVFVGRLHRDLYNPKKWLFWVVADNLRKGAALNGIQIAEKIFGL